MQQESSVKATLKTKENYLKEVEQKSKFEEMYKVQLKLIEDKDRDERQHKQEEVHQRQQELQDKVLVEERRRGETDTKKIKY